MHIWHVSCLFNLAFAEFNNFYEFFRLEIVMQKMNHKSKKYQLLTGFQGYCVSRLILKHPMFHIERQMSWK